MTQPLHKTPYGWLGLLDLKTTGRVPIQVGDAVTPVIDVADMYGAILLASNQNVSATGGSPRAAVLAKEDVGRHHALSLAFATGAAFNGTYISWRIGVQPPTAGVQVELFAGLVDMGAMTLAAGETLFFGGWLDRPLLLPPGSRITANLSTDATGVDMAIVLCELVEVLGTAP